MNTKHISFRACDECKSIAHGHFWINDDKFGIGVPNVNLGLWLYRQIEGYTEVDIPRITQEIQNAGLPQSFGEYFESEYRRKVGMFIVGMID